MAAGVVPYSPEAAARVCALVEAGASLRAVGRRADMPSFKTLLRWTLAHPEFGRAYRQACEARADRAAKRGRADPGRGGRPTTYSVKLARRICAWIAAGHSQVSLKGKAWAPGSGVMSRWMRAHPEFARMYRAACLRRAEKAAAAGVRDPGAKSGVSGFSEALAERICALTADGWSLKKIAARPDMPSMRTIHAWMHEHPWFRRLYLVAAEEFDRTTYEGNVAIAEKALGEGWAEGRGTVTARDALAHAKLLIATRNAWAARRRPVAGMLGPEAAAEAEAGRAKSEAELRYWERVKLLE